MTTDQSVPGASSRPPSPPAAAPIDLGLPGVGSALEIGRGAAGVVYRAEQPGVNRTVAVKLLPFAALDQPARQRFERECKAMGALSNHPGIVTVYDAGFTTHGQPYLIMELMEGGSVNERLARHGRFAWQEAVEIGIRLASALAAAHAKGVLHRDVKPDNVLISAYGDAKLADFSIARLAGATHTQTGLISATPAHAAPEILRGGPPTAAADVYSLGSTILTLMLGSPAFVRDTDSSIYPVMTRVERDPIPDLRPLGVPDPVCRVLERAMAKDARLRPHSASEFERELRTAREAGGAGGWVPTDAGATAAMVPPLAGPATAPPSGVPRLAVATAAAVLLAAGGGGAYLAAHHGGSATSSSTVSQPRGSATSTAAPGGNTGSASSTTVVTGTLGALLLTQADVPNGYNPDAAGVFKLDSVNPCNAAPDTTRQSGEASDAFQNVDLTSATVSAIAHSVGAFGAGGAAAYMASVERATRACTSYTASGADATVATRNGGTIGDETARFDLVTTSGGVSINSSFVLVRSGDRVSVMDVAGTAAPASNDTLADHLAATAAVKPGG